VLQTRPLVLKRSPQPIEVVSVVPDGPPIRFCWQGAEHVVERSWGPERLETGWWRGPHIRRDYYRVETTLGRGFWLFRARETETWFLHGVFE
jgi:protein ImuB